MHEFTGGEGEGSGRLVVVVGRRAVRDEVGEGGPLRNGFTWPVGNDLNHTVGLHISKAAVIRGI